MLWKRLAVPVFLAAAALAVLLAPAPASSRPVERLFHLTAGQFAYSPSVLRVNPGDRVTIELAAVDIVHGLAVDGYDVDLSADPGQTAKVTFTADKPGVYRFRCSVTCGSLHPFMIGKLQVGANILYWRFAGLAVLALVLGIWRWRA